MSSFSLVISPPDPSQAGFTESSLRPIFPKEVRTHGAMSHYAPLPYAMRILSFGSWLEPRYIFAAGRLD